MPADPLTSLAPHILPHLLGERRKRLFEYLARWGEYATANTYLQAWLDAQPGLATLREMHASVLVDLNRADEALVVLDELDAERGVSAGRRAARIRALAMLRAFEPAHALIPDRPDDPATWRQRAELFRREGRYRETAEALARSAELMPDGAEPTRALAELALAQGDAQRAQQLLRQRIERAADATPATRDLQLLHQAALALGDNSEVEMLTAQLAERRAAECRALHEDLGLDRIATPEEQAAEPPPVELLEHHAEAQVADATLAALQAHFGFDMLRPGQATVIERVLRGENVLGVLPTGAGKSLTYQLPALLIDGATLVISPLIALMKDQIDNLPPALAERATTINSALDGSAVAARLRGIAEGRYTLIYIAPERLRQQPFVQALKRVGVVRVVVDEVHCVSLWGISFRPDYLFIRQALQEIGNPPVLGLTATATPDTETEIKSHLGDLATVRTSIFRPNLRFEVEHVANKNEKLVAVLDLCRATPGPVVVYVRSREGCEEVALYLRRKGQAAEHYHAQVGDRAAVQDRFMRGETRILVATVAFGMGVDKADVRAIIHYNLPQSVEAYYQEAGRAGRDGLPARCILLYAPTDKGQLTGWLREEALSKEYLREIYRQLKRQVPNRWGIVSLEELRRELREDDETKMRVALGLLERVGLLSRHYDLPRVAGVTLRDSMFGDEQFTSFTQAAQLIIGVPTDLDLLELAEQLDIAPDLLERLIIGWHSQGLLRYSGGGRDLLIEMRPASADVSTKLDALLNEYAERQNQRVEAIAAYARAARCRHRVIAEHFGERMAACGTACDICAPTDERRTTNGQRQSDRSSLVVRRSSVGLVDATAAILATVKEMPGVLGEKDVVCVLLGMPGYPTTSTFGQLAGADFAATRGVVTSLVASGRLAYRNRALVPVNGAPRPAGPELVRDAILLCLGRLPFAVGKSGLAKILKGAAGSPIGPERCPDYAALAHMTGAAIEAEIERLIEQGDLRRTSGPRPLLAVVRDGVAEQPF